MSVELPDTFEEILELSIGPARDFIVEAVHRAEAHGELSMLRQALVIAFCEGVVYREGFRLAELRLQAIKRGIEDK